MPPSAAARCAFLAGGDIALNRPRARGAFGRLAPLLRSAGVAFANLELPLSRGGAPAPEKIALRGAPEMAGALEEAGFDALSFANNHALDYGEGAFLETLSRMKAGGIALAGAGGNLARAGRPAIVERGGLRIGLLCYTSILPRGFAATPERPGVNPLPARTAYRPPGDPAEYPGTAPKILTWADPGGLARMRRQVRALKRRADLAIVSHHWGTSMVHAVRDFQREIARAAVSAGADLVLGGHPHVPQGVEFFEGVPIVYSMGNLIFDFDIPFFTEATRQTFLFGCRLGRRGVEAPFLLPCRSGAGGAPALLSPRRGAGRAIVGLLESLSAPLGTRLRVRGARVLLAPGGK